MRKSNFFILLGVIAALCAGKANANVIGFDFGSNFFKIVLVKPAAPFTIVENVTSKRKTENYMSIGPEERKFGVDSLTLGTKVPKTTFTQAAFLLGVDFQQDEVTKMVTDEFVMNELVVDDRGLIAYQSFSIKEGDDDTNARSDTSIYYTEEIVSQILGYGKFLAERQAQSSVVDTVLTVPNYFTQEQRRMLQQAAEIAGLEVI